MASWPKRWPRGGYRSRNRPPRTASSLKSVSACIRIEFVAKTRIGEQSACGGKRALMHKDPPRQHAQRAFQHAHVLVEHDVRDIGLRQYGFDCGDQNGVVGT